MSNKTIIEEKAITLIALVITIVVLIILATVTINYTLGENGLINQAKNTKNSAENTVASSSGKMNELLQEYTNVLSEDATSPEEPDLPTAEETLDISDNKKIYVKIPNIKNPDNPIICNVLYNDATRGLQVIATTPLENVTIGIKNNFDENIKIYNDDAINILNNKAMEYLNQNNENYSIIKDIVSDVRCVGSDPVDKNKDDAQMFTSTYSYMKDYNNIFKDSNNVEKTDASQMFLLDIYDNVQTYWMASRMVFESESSTIFAIISAGQNTSGTGVYLCIVTSSGMKYADVCTDGLRPVFKLKPNVKVTGGDGLTPETAYTLGV